MIITKCDRTGLVSYRDFRETHAWTNSDRVCFKAGFHMIADRRSQIVIRSAIVCDRLRSCAIIWKLLLRSSAILRSRSQTIAEDRTMFYLKAGFHMIADDRRPYCDLRSAICDPRSYGNQPLVRNSNGLYCTQLLYLIRGIFTIQICSL